MASKPTEQATQYRAGDSAAYNQCEPAQRGQVAQEAIRACRLYLPLQRPANLPTPRFHSSREPTATRGQLRLQKGPLCATEEWQASRQWYRMAPCKHRCGYAQQRHAKAARRHRMAQNRAATAKRETNSGAKRPQNLWGLSS